MQIYQLDHDNRTDYLFMSCSNGMAGMRITEVSENGRAGRPDYSPRREDRRESRRDDRDDIEGYDYYR